MSRQILEADLDKLDEVAFTAPVRLVYPAPRRGGPAVASIRAALAPKGKLRLSGTPLSTFADLDPGPSEPPQLALETIVRSDAAGLERMLLSVLPHVDEIVLGVDGRSDEETLRVAQAFADCVFVFEAEDLKLSTEAWTADKIDFAAARNLGRGRVHSPWTLVIDSDEYLQKTVDLRQLVAGARPMQGAFATIVQLQTQQPGVKSFESRDYQRLARTKYRWMSATHNQLMCDESEKPEKIETVIVSDTSVRVQAEQDRRDAQRGRGIDELIKEAAEGNLNALFHVAKHKAGAGDFAEAARLAEDFRLRVEPNSVLDYQRQWVALAVACLAYHNGDLVEANRWACRALLDGPAIAAFCVLGDCAEDEGDLARAKNWYEAACAVTDTKGIAWPRLTEMRWGRLAALRIATSSPEMTEAVRSALLREQEREENQTADNGADDQQ